MTDSDIDFERRDAMLGEFAGRAETPIIVCETPVRHRHHESGEMTVVGYRATSNRGPAYISPREREQHFYRKREAYAISLDLLNTVVFSDARETVFIGENDTGTLYEYPAEFFDPGHQHSFILNYEDGDEQVAVPVERATSWDADEVRLS